MPTSAEAGWHDHVTEAPDAEGWCMNETSGGPEGVMDRDDAFPDVTEVPLLGLAPQGDGVLAAAIRRLIEDVVNERDITAGFGNAP